MGSLAAHDVGLLHRDFKPDNAIIGDDGRVRVLDFGLARAMEDAAVPAPPSTPTSGSDAFAEKLTQAGSTLGTPAYMAPEQFLGEPTDARTDVFAFCVALFEALYGKRPFTGSTRYALAQAVTEGQLVSIPAGHDVPPWLHQTVLQGLEPDPAERPASMREVLTRIDVDPDRRTKQVFAGLALAGVGGFAAAMGFVGGTEAAPEPCAGFEERLVDVWDEERRAAVEAAFTRRDVGWQAATFEPVATALDTHGTRLVEAFEQACRATRVSGEQSEAVLDLRTACVEDRIRSMGALTEVLAEADATAIALATEAVASLPDPTLCANTTLLTAGEPVPTDASQRARIEASRETLATAEALLSTGMPQQSATATTPMGDTVPVTGVDSPPADAVPVMLPSSATLADTVPSKSRPQRTVNVPA